MIITISGDPGSGKSTVALTLGFRAGYPRVNAGGILREWSKDPTRNPKQLSFQKWYAQLNPETDFEADEELKKAAQSKDHIILEGRMAFHWAPHGKPSLKVFLSINPEIAGQRVYEQKKRDVKIRKEETSYESAKEAQEDLEKRKQTEIERYEKLYGINPYDLKHYDLVIDTSYQTPEEVVQQILTAAGVDKGASTPF